MKWRRYAGETTNATSNEWSAGERACRDQTPPGPGLKGRGRRRGAGSGGGGGQRLDCSNRDCIAS